MIVARRHVRAEMLVGHGFTMALRKLFSGLVQLDGGMALVRYMTPTPPNSHSAGKVDFQNTCGVFQHPTVAANRIWLHVANVLLRRIALYLGRT